MSANVLCPCYEFNKISDRCRVKIGSVLPNRTNIVDFVVINTIGGGYFPTAQMYMYDVMKKSSQKTCAIIIVLFCVTLCISFFAFMREKKGQAKS